MADVRASDLNQETASTLTGDEQFVMFDAAEGKRCSVNELQKYVRSKVGSTERKNVRCNNTEATTEKAGFFYKQEVPWTNMTVNDHVDWAVSSGSYNSILGVESAAGKAVIFFLTAPSTNLYLNVYREVTST